MSKGFFTIAQGKQYQRMAYGLALSLKLSQKKYSNLSIGVTKQEIKKIPSKYKMVFDEIVEIPWKDDAKKSKWKLENEWKSIYMSPYDETIKLDADMLFFTDITNWWSILEGNEAVFTTDVLTYRNEKATSTYYRKVFVENNLPNVYSAFFYFKKTDKVFEFFKLSELIFNNWQKFFEEFLEPIHRPHYVSTDVVFAIAAKILEFEELNHNRNILMPTFVHMKTKMQNWPDDIYSNEDWTKMIPVYFTPECICKIGNYLQIYPLHYYVKNFLTDEKIYYMEKKLGV
jgi:hypothetical protein